MNFFLLINLKLLTIANSFLLNIAEHENFSANMKMPAIVGIFIFISRENFMLSWVEHVKCFITSGPGQYISACQTYQNIPSVFKVKTNWLWTDGYASECIFIQKSGIWHISLVRSCQYASPHQKYQNILRGLKVTAIFSRWLLVDGHSRYRAHLISPPFGRLYCGSRNYLLFLSILGIYYNIFFFQILETRGCVWLYNVVKRAMLIRDQITSMERPIRLFRSSSYYGHMAVIWAASKEPNSVCLYFKGNGYTW